MSLIKPKQISKLLASFLEIPSFTASGQNSDDISSVLSTTLTANSLPIQVGSNIQSGIDTTIGYNYCKLFNASTERSILDTNGNNIYGKINFSAPSTWTIEYYSSNLGSENQIALTANLNIKIEIPYIYSFNDLPMRSLVSQDLNAFVNIPLALPNFLVKADNLTVTSENVLSNLSQHYNGNLFLLVVNGVVYTPYGNTPFFSVNGNGLTWNNSTGLNLLPEDNVLAIYTY